MAQSKILNIPTTQLRSYHPVVKKEQLYPIRNGEWVYCVYSRKDFDEVLETLTLMFGAGGRNKRSRWRAGWVDLKMKLNNSFYRFIDKNSQQHRFFIKDEEIVAFIMLKYL